MFLLLTLTILLSVSNISCGGDGGGCANINVPGDHPTIQEAIDAAFDGCVILVSDGEYKENIDFNGKAITIKSTNGAQNTTIDASNTGSAVSFLSGEGAD
jgi:pectin methylesterase-like acyl-CoA thioesterase